MNAKKFSGKKYSMKMYKYFTQTHIYIDRFIAPHPYILYTSYPNPSSSYLVHCVPLKIISF